MALEIIYSENGLADRWNSEVMNEIKATSKLSAAIPFSCYPKDGKWGIWIQVWNTVFPLDPLDLVDSLFEKDSDIYVAGNDLSILSIHYPYSYEWTIVNKDHDKVIMQLYMQNEYVNSVH